MPMSAAREGPRSIRAWPLFAFFVLLALGWSGVIGLMVLLMQIQPGFTGMAHFSEPHHRIHDLTYGFLFATAAVGMLAQLRRPLANVAGMSMALVPWVALLVAAILSSDTRVVLSSERMSAAILMLFAALLHPTGNSFFRSFKASRVDRVLFGWVAIAALPLVAFAATNIGLQATVDDDHAVTGHYGFMAAFSFTVIALGVLSSLKPDGWEVPAWVAGLLPVLLGVTSLLYPDASSSLGPMWSVAAIGWGVATVARALSTRTATVSAMEGPSVRPVTTHRAGGR
jgi:hypothetical protein